MPQDAFTLRYLCEELNSIFIYCPIQTIVNVVYINKKCRKSIEEGHSNSEISQAVSKKETKLFSHTDILRGRMTDLVHALSLKNWKKRLTSRLRCAIAIRL